MKELLVDTRPDRRWPFAVALTGHCTVVAALYAASGLVAPSEGVAVLAVIWFAALVGLVRLPRTGAVPLTVPLLAVGVWFAVVTFGDVVLGWTA